MTISTIPVNTDKLAFEFGEVKPKFGYKDGKRTDSQEVNDDGVPLYTIVVNIINEGEEEFGSARVVVPSRTEPVHKFQQPIKFDGLTCRPWSSDNGSGQSWSAISFKVDTPVSAKPINAGTK